MAPHPIWKFYYEEKYELSSDDSTISTNADNTKCVAILYWNHLIEEWVAGIKGWWEDGYCVSGCHPTCNVGSVAGEEPRRNYSLVDQLSDTHGTEERIDKGLGKS